MDKTFKSYKEHTVKIKDLSALLSLSSWDKEVKMPPKGAKFRSQQITTLSMLMHELQTDKKYVDLLKHLAENKNLNAFESANVKKSLEYVDKVIKLPKDLVLRANKAISSAFHSWQEAKAKNDFNIFAGKLEEIVDLSIEKAEICGYDDHPYDALMDDYEKGLKTETLTKLFDKLETQLTDKVLEISKKPKPDAAFMHLKYDESKQMAICKQIVQDLGYDMQAGRLDLSPHPFSTNFSPEDVRITTRIKEDDLIESVSSAMHEAGHALYEQGLSIESYGLPASQATSLSIHESQSRLYENHVGRSRAWVEAYLPLFKSYFPEQLKAVDADSFYNALNIVQPGFIRTSADELTYHFHIMVRFRIEKALIEKSINVKEVPVIWAELYEKYLGIKPEKDSLGALQDIHWSHGSFGYFPTYSLGSFYAAQFFEQAEKDISGLDTQIANKDYTELLGFLRKHIHQHGNLLTSDEICKKLTGKSLDVDCFTRYADKKFAEIYDL